MSVPFLVTLLPLMVSPTQRGTRSECEEEARVGERQRWGAFVLNIQGHPSVAPPPIARYPSTSSQPVESGRPGANRPTNAVPWDPRRSNRSHPGLWPSWEGLLAGAPLARPPPHVLSRAVWVVLAGPSHHQHRGRGLPDACAESKAGEGPSEAGPGPLGRGWGWPTCCA